VNRLRTALLLSAGVLALAAAGRRHRSLLAKREHWGLTTAAPLENAPPLVAFTTVALGGFRGLLADMLWLRVSHLQDEGRTVELVQLSDWITKLEPRCTEIWAFHAWNMAYNVSVMLPDYSARWRWVHNGIRLLRDEGLVYNPGAPDLYCELGWLFQHKVGAHYDTAHRVYQREWAAAMAPFQPGARMDYAALAADPALRARLERTLKLDPDTMRRIDAAYGPLNWRTAEAQAAYWGYRGRQAAEPGVYLPADRMVFQSLAALFFKGNRPGGRADPGTPPAVELFPGIVRAYREALRRYRDESVRTAYGNFLAAAAQRLARTGHEALARQAYDLWRSEAATADPLPAFEEWIRP
jgi:hypothetical protein